MRTIREPKRKQHYNVYIIGHGSGCYREDYCRQFAGETWAVSAAQACNNVRFQNRNKEQPHGGYSVWGFGDICEEGDVMFTYEAELAEV